MKILSLLLIFAASNASATSDRYLDRFPSAVFGMSSGHTGSMYLGEWKNDMAAKIMPSYFDDIVNNKSRFNSQSTSVLSSLLPSDRYNTHVTRATSIVFTNNTSIFENNNGLLFSFRTETSNANDFSINKLIGDQIAKTGISKSGPDSKFVNQQLYAPGYSYTYGLSSFGFAAVLVQQNFIDTTFGSMTLESSKSSSLYNDKVLFETNRGIGYQLNYSQNLPFDTHLMMDYQSKIEMNEFGNYGNNYKDPGDFDIPENYALSLNIPVVTSDWMYLKAQRIHYNDITAKVHGGYSEDFLRIFNSPVQPSFEWDDLTVYSIGYERLINKEISLGFDLTSRQQAPAVDEFLNQILDDDTAEYSYKLSLKQQLAGGELNLFASYANKPVMIGRTDFGRFTKYSENTHIEAGISWNMNF